MDKWQTFYLCLYIKVAIYSPYNEIFYLDKSTKINTLLVIRSTRIKVQILHLLNTIGPNLTSSAVLSLVKNV